MWPTGFDENMSASHRFKRFEALQNVHFIFVAIYKSDIETERVCMEPLLEVHHRVFLWFWIFYKCY